MEDKVTRRTSDEKSQTDVKLVKGVMAWGGHPLKPPEEHTREKNNKRIISTSKALSVTEQQNSNPKL